MLNGLFHSNADYVDITWYNGLTQIDGYMNVFVFNLQYSLDTMHHVAICAFIGFATPYNSLPRKRDVQ